MPSAALVAHEGTSLAWPSTATRQMRQFPTMGSLGYQQSVGMLRPALRAASRMVAPSLKATWRPLRVMVGMVDQASAPASAPSGESGLVRTTPLLGRAAPRRRLRVNSSRGHPSYLSLIHISEPTRLL